MKESRLYISFTKFGADVEVCGVKVLRGSVVTVSVEPFTIGPEAEYQLHLDGVYGPESVYMDLVFDYNSVYVSALVFKDSESFKVEFTKSFSSDFGSDENSDENEEDKVEELSFLGVRIKRVPSNCYVEL
jgi:hypothetical protein